MSFSMSLAECQQALGLEETDSSYFMSGVSIDTRTLSPGDLYVAIRGDRYNGHDFIDDAQSKGASALLVDEQVNSELPILQVENTVSALGSLARVWAQRFNVPTIAITGSNGKTTVKEITAAILRQLGPVLSTQGNLNNELGVPLTLLRLRNEHLYAVIEMGANHAGEIARLVDIAKPDVAVITNIGNAHLEGFGSIDGIAKAKSEIYAGLASEGYAVINADDAYVEQLRSAAKHCARREFGLSVNADVRGIPGAGLTIQTLGRKLHPRFQLTGDHNGMNALAAVAAVECLDVQPANIVRGLESVQGVPGRLEKKPGLHGSTLIDDSYNANPDSTEQAIRVLARYEGIRYLVLGDMAELGEDAENLHARVGEFASKAGIDGLWTIGALSSSSCKAFAGKISVGKPLPISSTVTPLGKTPVSLGAHFTDQESLVSELSNYLGSGVTVLVKGSRSAKMERVVKGLLPVKSASRVSIQEQPV